MMYYVCELCRRPIKKPYPSKKYCSIGCRENSRKARVEEQEAQFWNSIEPVALTPADQQKLEQLEPGPRAGRVIERMAPAGAVGYRVGCRRIGADAYTVHWFPTARQRPSSMFKLNPVELPIEIPCPTVYAVIYFDAAARQIHTAYFKLLLRAYVVGVNWSDGDRRLLIDRAARVILPD